MVVVGGGVGDAAEGLVAKAGGWSSKNFVVWVVPLTQDGGACRIPQRVLCGGRVPPGPAATVSRGSSGKARLGDLLRAYGCGLVRDGNLRLVLV